MSGQQNLPGFSRAELAVGAFTASYMLVALATAMWRKNPEFAFYLIIMCILIAATIWIHVRIRLRFSTSEANTTAAAGLPPITEA